MGGLSKPPYESLNLGFSSGDEIETIKKNRLRFFEELGITEKNLASSKLVHGNKVLVAHKPVSGEGYDAIITNIKGIYAAVSVADCAPVLIYDTKQKAVAAIHAGWRSTVAKVVREALSAMQANYGTKGEDCLAFIGSCISGESFEVGEEVAVQFEEDVRYFDTEKQKYFVDLKKENKKQLMQMGVKENNIEVSPYCTVLNNETFFSYRKGKGKTGRMLALIGMKELKN